MRFSKGVTLVLCLLVVTVFVAATFAQETTAGLQGTVKDPQGAVVSKAVVEVTSPALIGNKKLETDSSFGWVGCVGQYWSLDSWRESVNAVDQFI